MTKNILNNNNNNKTNDSIISVREQIAEENIVVSNHYMVVVPGQVITTEGSYLRGHGTYVDGNQLIANVPGIVVKVNQLITVKPLKSRYLGEVGDIIVGKITSVGSTRWKVDVNSYQDATLLLSSVNLPGGVQRRRTYEDQLQMRTFFNENDLISAEVQDVRYDGSLWLHTRNLRYGKLENGQLVIVMPSLIKRAKNHVVTLKEIGVDLILGTNGYIWLTATSEKNIQEPINDNDMNTNNDFNDVNTILLEKKIHAERIIKGNDRKKIAIIANIISELNLKFRMISPESILSLYDQKYT